MDPDDELDVGMCAIMADFLKKPKSERETIISEAILSQKTKEEASHLDLGYDLGELPAGYDNR